MLPTPQHAWPLLNQRAGCEVWVKHENHTATGAFKIRGGIVMLDALKRAKLTGKVHALFEKDRVPLDALVAEVSLVLRQGVDAGARR